MSKKKKLILSLSLVILIAGWLAYNWFFQVLPQPAVFLLDDVKPPNSEARILVFSPHPDDETLSAGGYIASNIEAGGKVWIVLVTDGNRHGQGRERYQEFKEAVRILGVPEENLFFLNYPDRGLKKENKEEIYLRFKNIIDQTQPNIIIAPIGKDQHPDHAIVGEIVEEIAKKENITLYQYLVHYENFPSPKRLEMEKYLLPPIRMISFDKKWKRYLLFPEIEDLKYQAILQYHTQMRSPLSKKLLLSFVRKNELFAVPLFSKE